MTGQRKKRIAGSYFVSTLSISLVLVVVGILVFILLNAKLVSDHVKQNIGFSIIVKDNVNEAEIKKMQKILDTKPFVSSSVFISKVEAAREFKVSYQKSLVHMINENVRRISLILLIAGAALMLISFTLIRNTIHLSVYSQRFLIKTMQLVGAKPFFICKPFIQNSVWFGFFGSMIANLILLAAIFFLQKEVGSVVNLMNKELIIIMVAFVMVCGILLSLVSSWMSVARYLNKDMNDLYN